MCQSIKIEIIVMQLGPHLEERIGERKHDRDLKRFP